jgi:hypothetical protein
MIRISTFFNSRSSKDLATTNLSREKSEERLQAPRDPAQDQNGLYIWRVVLQVAAGSAEFAASVRNPVLLGRSDPTTGSRPDIDLTSVGGQDMGVSRHHAILIPTDEGLCVIDLDTANGTSINGQRLVSGRRYRLRGGDRLDLGTLRLTVSHMGILPRGRTPHSTIILNRKAEQA